MYTTLYSKMANAHWPLAQSYTAKAALYSAIQYTAIQRYTVYNLYNTPLTHATPHTFYYTP